MKEYDITTEIKKYAIHVLQKTCPIEVKICKEKSLPFSRLEEHQEASLWAVYTGTFCFKIADVGYRNPFDLVCYHKEDAYIAIMFYERGTKDFYLIHIKDWKDIVTKNERKSLTEEEAERIGTKHTLK